jgi:hypothetical protein
MRGILEQTKRDAGSSPHISRRLLLEGSVSASFVGVGTTWSQDAAGSEHASVSARQTAAFLMRQGAAQAYLHEQQPVHRSNGDEAHYADKRASFAKTLPHDDVGEVDPNAFAAFVNVLSDGDPTKFETIPRDRRAEVELNDPQATYAFDLVGLDGAATSLDPPPTFAGARMATEMAELYWLSLTRDVPFRHYETDQLITEAVTDLNAFSEPLTSSTGTTKATPATVFRGETPADLIGPYLSQFLWLDIPYGIKTTSAELHCPGPRTKLSHDLRSVAMPPAFTTVPTASADSSSASSMLFGSCETTAALTMSGSMASSSEDSMETR